MRWMRHCRTQCMLQTMTVHVQMGLDTKRAEMAKLEERARQRAAALAQVRTCAAQLVSHDTGKASD